nr:hypothetical protein 13 [Gammaproteobacteria bacterium]
MITTVLPRAALIWLLIALLAIANGALRDNVLSPLIGREAALPLSGVILSLIVLLVTYFSRNYLRIRDRATAWLIGVQWVGMTLIFEFNFGHYVAGKSWAELMQTFNLFEGDLFLLVLLVSLTAPNLVLAYREKRQA